MKKTVASVILLVIVFAFCAEASAKAVGLVQAAAGEQLDFIYATGEKIANIVCFIVGIFSAVTLTVIKIKKCHQGRE